jgi:glycosyltransferase involved in cell wall biosynthesis
MLRSEDRARNRGVWTTREKNSKEARLLKSARTVSVIIPVFNEAATLQEIARRVSAAAVEITEVIFVDDASTDGSRDILEELAGHSGYRILFQDKNQGKGAALARAIPEVTGDIVIFQDADLEYDPVDYPKLITPLLDGKADVVYGSRFAGSEAHRVLYFWHSVGNRLLTCLSNMFTDLNLSDMETCLKAFRREVIQDMTVEEPRFGIEPEITAKIAQRKLRIYEVGISYAGRTYAEGKKISWRDGLRAVYCILKYNLFRGKRAR